ncbi:hypothetical protein BSPWISOXPB_4620 [uncultured Gammaproteobacteria bacterium]|nr:hypothetical protein BSPWISOXPB_4620 [uncultured Gammaproteobacteria bacterium]
MAINPLLGHPSTNQSNSLKAQTLQPSPTVPIEAVTKKCKQEVATHHHHHSYFGKVYEKIKQNTNTEHKHFIYLDKQLIAIHIKTDTTSQQNGQQIRQQHQSLTKPATSTTTTSAQ